VVKSNLTYGCIAATRLATTYNSVLVELQLQSF